MSYVRKLFYMQSTNFFWTAIQILPKRVTGKPLWIWSRFLQWVQVSWCLFVFHVVNPNLRESYHLHFDPAPSKLSEQKWCQVRTLMPIWICDQIPLRRKIQSTLPPLPIFQGLYHSSSTTLDIQSKLYNPGVSLFLLCHPASSAKKGPHTTTSAYTKGQACPSFAYASCMFYHFLEMSLFTQSSVLENSS